jgi:CRP-like cAMP-binding protein
VTLSAHTTELNRIWASSAFARFPESAQEALLATANEQEIKRGQNLYRELPTPRFVYLALMINGLAMNYVTSPLGRRIVTRYWRPGDIVGLTSIFMGGAPSGVDVVRSGSILRLDATTFEGLAKTDAEVSYIVAQELARRVVTSIEMQMHNTFGSVRVRVAWHLLQQSFELDGHPVVQIRQQELADCVGSVREVVARELAELQQRGIVNRQGDLLVIADSERLAELARSLDG